jgi:starch synthase
MKVLYACSEIFPLLKTGGLADVSAALPPALREVGCDVRLLLPGFPAIRDGVRAHTPPAAGLALPGGGPRVAGIFPGPVLQRAVLPGSGLETYVLDVPQLFNRPGDPYLDTKGDNGLRFALCGWAAACLGQGLDPQWQPDVLHCHDWHTGLAPLYLRQMAMPRPPRAASVFTVHNLAYQGTFGYPVFEQLGLPGHLFGIGGVEFYGQLSFMKAGLQSADRITTVSPGYAREIMEPAQGCGLDGLLRERSTVVSGILNGVDYAVWSPAVDPALARKYEVDSLAGKGANKAQLQRQLGLEQRQGALLCGVVSRLSEQKGLHLVAGVVDACVAAGGQLAVLGSGEAWLEQAFREAAQRHPGQVAVHLGFSETLAHQIIGGADTVLVPSQYEPCGLTQLYGLRYGTLPLVRRVGGLADTVVDATAQSLADGSATGFVFDEFSAPGLDAALQRALHLFAQPQRWAAMQQQAMRQRFAWADAAARYRSLYDEVQPLARSRDASDRS